MTVFEVTLLVAGVVIFALGFILPGKGETKSEKDIAAEKEQIQKLMESELDAIKQKADAAADETVDLATQKAERSLEKVSNEKIMAVNEYAGTILEEINKNHQEVMFLYDMLKDKQTEITSSVREADDKMKEMKDLSAAAKSASESLKQGINVVNAQKKGLSEEQKSVFDVFDEPENREFFSKGVAEPEPPKHVESMAKDMISGGVYHQGTLVENETVKPIVKYPSIPTPPKSEASVSEYVEADAVSEENSNDRILLLHNQGMSTVDIARELKLGVGEVKLVIDLYR